MIPSHLTPKPEPPPDIESSSCDWGQCNQQGEFWRWELRMRVWLPVCPRHALKVDREREANQTEGSGT